jgi:hypothetical protein
VISPAFFWKAVVMNERVDIVLRVNEENSPMKERMEERYVDIRFEKARGDGSHGARVHLLVAGIGLAAHWRLR